MSAQQFQTAMSHLMRLPIPQGQTIDNFFAQYELTSIERTRLKALNGSSVFQNYAKTIQFIRRRDTFIAIPTVKQFVPEAMLADLFDNDFEPQALDVRFLDLPLQFLDFLSTSDTAKEKLKSVPAFVFDIVRLERAQIRMHDPSPWPSPQGSYLATGEILLIPFYYDVPRFIKTRAKDNGESPIQRACCYLMIRAEGHPGYRMFEVDAETRQFLESQLASSEACSLPQSYEQLKKIGLCR